MMIGVYGLMCVLMLIMRLFPDSEAGRLLNRQLVEEPMRRLARFERHHLIFALIIVGFMLGGSEFLLLAGPELATAFAIDLSIYFDAVMVAYALTAVAVARKSGGWLRFAIVTRLRALRPRAKRPARRAKPARKPSNDDDPAPALLAA